MRNTETITNAVLRGTPKRAGALSTDGRTISSYAMVIARQTGFDSWEVVEAGARSVTTSRHCNGVAEELRRHGKTVFRVEAEAMALV